MATKSEIIKNTRKIRETAERKKKLKEVETPKNRNNNTKSFNNGTKQNNTGSFMGVTQTDSYYKIYKKERDSNDNKSMKARSANKDLDTVGTGYQFTN